VETGCLLHLLKPFDGHHCGQRLAFPLNDELMVTQRNAVENVAKLLPDFQD
jgi:hypothetical protein